MFGSASGVAPGLRVDSGGTALQEDVTLNGLMIPVTAKSFSVPSCSVAHSVTEDDAMDDSAEIPAARDGTVPPIRRRASISGGERAELHFDRAEPQKFVAVNWFSIPVLASN